MQNLLQHVSIFRCVENIYCYLILFHFGAIFFLSDKCVFNLQKKIFYSVILLEIRFDMKMLKQIFGVMVKWAGLCTLNRFSIISVSKCNTVCGCIQ